MAQSKIEYVCGFMLDDSERLWLLRKEKPSWQAGKLNGVGGKVEPGELAVDAMHREWGEETGDDTDWPWRYFATQSGKGYSVHFYSVRVRQLPTLPSKNDVGEWFERVHLSEILVHHTPVIPNLRWLLPLAFSDPMPLVVKAVEA